MSIKVERIRLGMTQKELADAIGVTDLTIGKYEKDPLIAKGKELTKMADLFGCSVDYLLERNPDRRDI